MASLKSKLPLKEPSAASTKFKKRSMPCSCRVQMSYLSLACVAQLVAVRLWGQARLGPRGWP